MHSNYTYNKIRCKQTRGRHSNWSLVCGERSGTGSYGLLGSDIISSGK